MEGRYFSLREYSLVSFNPPLFFFLIKIACPFPAFGYLRSPDLDFSFLLPFSPSGLAISSLFFYGFFYILS